MSKEWCTDIQDEDETYSCKDTCKQFGYIMCSGQLLSFTYKERNNVENKKAKSCCCLSKCDPWTKQASMMKLKEKIEVKRQGNLYDKTNQNVSKNL